MQITVWGKIQLTPATVDGRPAEIAATASLPQLPSAADARRVQRRRAARRARGLSDRPHPPDRDPAARSVPLRRRLLSRSAVMGNGRASMILDLERVTAQGSQ